MRIREATVGDLPALVALNREVQTSHAEAFPERFRREPSDEQVASAFRSQIEAETWYWLVAEEDQVIAFLSAEFRQRDETWCTPSHRVCYVAGIVVDCAYRRRGVAKALLKVLKQEAQARRTVSLELDVWGFNESAQQAFGQLGFQPVMHRMQMSANLDHEDLA